MKRWLTILVMLLGSCSGCAMIEDMVLGPDPNLPDVTQPPTGSCQNPGPTVNTRQTAEPELLKR